MPPILAGPVKPGRPLRAGAGSSSSEALASAAAPPPRAPALIRLDFWQPDPATAEEDGGTNHRSPPALTIHKRLHRPWAPCLAAVRMPIPDLTSDGLLPRGVHQATLDEVRLSFGSRTPRRVELFNKLVDFVDLAKTFNIFKVIHIDGSFVTDKDDPGDIDAVLELTKPEAATLLAHPNAAAIIDAAAVKHRYEIHLFFAPQMTQFFQRLKPAEAIARSLAPDHWRGILKVDL